MCVESLEHLAGQLGHRAELEVDRVEPPGVLLKNVGVLLLGALDFSEIRADLFHVVVEAER